MNNMPIITSQVRKVLVEIAYDFYSDKVISVVFAQSEDRYSIGKVITDILITTKDNTYPPLVHLDQGSGNNS